VVEACSPPKERSFSPPVLVGGRREAFDGAAAASAESRCALSWVSVCFHDSPEARGRCVDGAAASGTRRPAALNSLAASKSSSELATVLLPVRSRDGGTGPELNRVFEASPAAGIIAPGSCFKALISALTRSREAGVQSQSDRSVVARAFTPPWSPVAVGSKGRSRG
jgi:hypothetical protein